MIFLWIFLPIVLIGNYLLNLIHFASDEKRIRTKNILLLAASLVFYAWGGIYYLFIMLSSIVINYFGARLICRYEKRKRLILVITII